MERELSRLSHNVAWPLQESRVSRLTWPASTCGMLDPKCEKSTRMEVGMTGSHERVQASCQFQALVYQNALVKWEPGFDGSQKNLMHRDETLSNALNSKGTKAKSRLYSTCIACGRKLRVLKPNWPACETCGDQVGITIMGGNAR